MRTLKRGVLADDVDWDSIQVPTLFEESKLKLVK
jgi:hypothetical protein